MKQKKTKLTIIDKTLAQPTDNLRFEEELLDHCDANPSGGFLRFWESSVYFIVLGRSNKAEVEVNISQCKQDQIPILRRVSGGGTVLQGPGCLNYALILPLHHDPALHLIDTSNQYILEKNCHALKKSIPDISVKGYTDIAIKQKKISGNAQRRKKNALLFHGTFLVNFKLDLIEKYLLMPSKQPNYRENRSHLNFIQNCNNYITKTQIKETLSYEWKN